MGLLKFGDRCGHQVNLLSNVTPRYLTVGFHEIGSWLNISGGGVGLRRRLNNTLTLFDGLIDIFQYLHQTDNAFKWFCRCTDIASGLRDSE